MSPRCRFIDRSRLLGAALLGLALLAPGNAVARTEILRWTHSRAGEVIRWEAHIGANAGSYDQVVQLTNATVGPDGVFQASIEIADPVVVFIALRAVGPGGLESPLSNARERRPASDGSGSGGATVVPVGTGQVVPSSPNAVHREDFLASPLGDSADGWVDTRANNSLSTDDSLFSIVDVAGDRALSTASPLSDIHSHLVGSGLSWSDMTLTGRFALDRNEAGMGVTAYSQYTNADRYYRLGRAPGGRFTIIGHPQLSCSNAGTGVSPQAGIWYRFEFSVSSESGQNRIQARVWPESDPRPSGPQAECVDSASDRATGGTVGVWASGSGQKYWDDLEVTTTSAPPPIPLAPPILIEVVPATP